MGGYLVGYRYKGRVFMFDRVYLGREDAEAAMQMYVDQSLVKGYKYFIAEMVSYLAG